MSLSFFRSFSNPAKKVTLNEEKSDLTLLWESHCSPMRKSTLSLKSNCVTPKSKKSEINFLNMLAAAKPQTPTKKLFVPPQTNLSRQSSLSRSQSNSNCESSANDILYSRISITTDQIFSIPEETKEFVSYVYAPTLNNKGNSEFQNEAWENFKNNNSKSSKCSVVSSATFAFIFINEFMCQTKVHVKSFTGTARQQIMEIVNPNNDSNGIDEASFLNIDYHKAIELIESLNAKEKISIFSTDPFHYSVVTPLSFKYSEFESAQGKLFRVTLNGYMFPYQAKQLLDEKSKFNVFKTSKSVLY